MANSPWNRKQREIFAQMSLDELFAYAYDCNGKEPDGPICIELILDEIRERIKELQHATQISNRNHSDADILIRPASGD